ncbi:HlyD family efflux transporter periplasmic adaptor subunit [Massilia phyllosphaerae]|uniref:HlyD family efflux transporter periplasmic adaptor subunit n=1 Tax=Massilia phyllosphaerae TaxID=3106034 RepID=UPI002B1CAF25|nr:HlyD family efflux transporter periplasmic adaptor subunit [Massilia sp. SGZ-792]
MRLPLLREELTLLPGAVLADGQPSHTLHDPVRNLFFQIDWPTFEILRRWDMDDPAAIARAVSHETALQLDAADVDDVAAFFTDNQLVRAHAGVASAYAADLRKRRGGAAQWLLHNYLFFRIPLLKPDRWLTRVAPYLDPLYTRTFLLLTLAALAFGAVEIYRQWDHFAGTLVDTITWRGMAGYAVALAVVKVMHELGHAMTAKRFGCRVPAMGLAFLVMWPVAYTDTNDVWRLTKRRQKLAVVGAGMAVELGVAAWATLAWALLPDGMLRSLAFVLAAVTWIASVAINASPFMRFDGYFLLSDWLEMPNLHTRAFALARWDLRERLFGLGVAAPEVFPRARHVGLILFAYATWLYRLTVFLGIASLVYLFFIKAIGIALFAIEIGWFVMLPLIREMRVWRTLWPVLRRRPRARIALAMFLALALVVFLPLPTLTRATGLLRPAAQFVIYSPAHAQVVDLPVADGQHVATGTSLMRLASPELEARAQGVASRLEGLEQQAVAGVFDPQQRARWQILQQQALGAQSEAASIQGDASRYVPVAPFAGTLRDIAPDLRPGIWLSAREPLARLVSDQIAAVAYVDEDDVERINVGDAARFYADAPSGPVVKLTVTSIEPEARRILDEPELATVFGGGIVAREKNGQFYPERPLYRVIFQAASGPQSHTWRGTVMIDGNWSAPGWRYLRNIVALVRRESGF